MFNKNNGSNEHDILQNQFTAYVKKAVHNRRIKYITQEAKRKSEESMLADPENRILDDTDYFQRIIEHEILCHTLRSIKEKERHIILARIVEEKEFKEIAYELGMTYKAVTCLYYRALRKMQENMMGGDDE